MKSIMESIQEFIKTCPLLKRGKICANYLDAKAVSYTIDSMQAPPILRQYTDGGSMRQYAFTFASRELYAKEEFANFDVMGFYEKFADWIEEQDDKRNYPVLDGGLIPTGIQIMLQGAPVDEKENYARYEIPCRLIYLKGAI